MMTGAGAVAGGVGDAHAVLAQQAQPLGVVGVVGGDHAAFARGDDLARVEAEAGHFAVAADRPALVAAADGAGGVLDDVHAVPRGQRREAVHVGGHADLMHDAGSPCVRGVMAASTAAGSRLYVSRIDVREDRRRAGVADGVGRGDERHATGR